MNPRFKELPARFGPETRFEVTPVPAPPFRGTRETELDQLKERLLKQLLEEVGDIELNGLFQRAANEASAIAWTTPFPLLVLPELLDEKVQSAWRRAERQKVVLRRSRRLLGVAV
jgi:hypothetical protein